MCAAGRCSSSSKEKDGYICAVLCVSTSVGQMFVSFESTGKPSQVCGVCEQRYLYLLRKIEMYAVCESLCK